MFSSQKSGERTKKTKEVRQILLIKKQKAKKYLILWSKIWQTLTSLYKKKVKYERGVPLQLATAARGCRRMAGTRVPQQLQSRSPLCRGATVPPGMAMPTMADDGLESGRQESRRRDWQKALSRRLQRGQWQRGSFAGAQATPRKAIICLIALTNRFVNRSVLPGEYPLD